MTGLSVCSLRRAWLAAVLVAGALLAGVAGSAAAGAAAGGTPSSDAGAGAGGGPGTAVTPHPAARWRAPLDPPWELTRGFDPPATPYGRGHRGVDLAAPPGSVVRAAGAGVVGYAGLLAGRGVVTVLHPGGLRTTYEPVAATVRAGTPVPAGASLGRLVAGHPGCPEAACLHWGLRRGADYLNPLALLGLTRIRLVPLDGWRPPVSRE